MSKLHLQSEISKASECKILAVQHCEDADCSLGTLAVDCPKCKENFDTCDNWYTFTDWDNQPKQLEFVCRYCKHNFVLFNGIDY